MEVTNETPFRIFLHRDHLGDAYALVDATVKTTYQSDGASWRFAREQEPVHGGPSERFAMGEAPYIRERGLTEVTVSGTIRAPSGRPFHETVAVLTAGEHRRTLRAFGRRWWQRRGNTIERTAPESVEGVSMGWQNAYGGRWSRPPGLIPYTKLPAPSTQILCAANPLGKGWIIDSGEAEGVELPQLEAPEDPIVAWNSRPTPRCWAPMPADSSLRMNHLAIEDGRLVNRYDPQGMLFARTRLNAPPELQLTGLAPGSAISLEGFRVGPPLRFVVPAPAVFWRVTAGVRERVRSPTLVAVHLDADAERVACVWHARLFAPLVRGERRVFTLTADRVSLDAQAPR